MRAEWEAKHDVPEDELELQYMTVTAGGGMMGSTVLQMALCEECQELFMAHLRDFKRVAKSCQEAANTTNRNTGDVT
jgi:hypothetical protein